MVHLVKNQLLTVEIIDMNILGFGIAKWNGAVIFVQNGVTGDHCEIKIIKCTKQYYVARIENRIHSSELRIPNACPVSRRCGGCNFQHIDYSYELIVKKQHIQSCLKKSGVLNTTVLDPLSTGVLKGYRNKAQFPVQGSDDGSVAVGFYANKTHSICPVEQCLIQDPLFSEITEFLCRYFTDHHWQPYCEADGSGLLRHIYLRIGKATGEVMLCLVLSQDSVPNEDHFVSAVTNRFPQIRSIVLNINDQNTNVILGEVSKTVYGDDLISDVLLDTRLNLSHRSFYQVNHDATELLYETAFKLAKIDEYDLILDLFCGIGSIALTSKAICPIVGVEIIPEAIENATENARINRRQNAHFVCGDANAAFDLISKSGSKNPLLILDPPRKGVSSELIRTISEQQMKKVLYISCGPDTLARDLSLFQKEGYSISPIQPVDLFPRTGHIECICLLDR